MKNESSFLHEQGNCFNFVYSFLLPKSLLSLRRWEAARKTQSKFTEAQSILRITCLAGPRTNGQEGTGGISSLCAAIAPDRNVGPYYSSRREKHNNKFIRL